MELLAVAIARDLIDSIDELLSLLAATGNRFLLNLYRCWGPVVCGMASK